MAKMEVLTPVACSEPDCGARATWVVKTDAGTLIGAFCTRHGQARCRAIAKQEGAKVRG